MEALFGIVLLLALVGGTLWVFSLGSCRMRTLVADRFLAWNMGIDSRGYPNTLTEELGIDTDDAREQIVQKVVFGESERTGRGRVDRVFYSWRMFHEDTGGSGGDDFEAAISDPPPHWSDDDWALSGGEAPDIWIGQNYAAVQVIQDTPDSAVAMLHDAVLYGFNRMLRRMPESTTIGGRVGGVKEGDQMSQVSACVTMRTGRDRDTLNDTLGEQGVREQVLRMREALGQLFVEPD